MMFNALNDASGPDQFEADNWLKKQRFNGYWDDPRPPAPEEEAEPEDEEEVSDLAVWQFERMLERNLRMTKELDWEWRRNHQWYEWWRALRTMP
jgi:hypothetical protein